jgi:hypothetical protein
MDNIPVLDKSWQHGIPVGNTISDKESNPNHMTRKLSYAEVTRRGSDSDRQTTKLQGKKVDNNMRQ